MRVRMWVLSLMLLSLTSCSGTGQGSNDFCQYAKAIYLDKADKLTPSTSRQILEHDMTGRRLCGWVTT